MVKTEYQEPYHALQFSPYYSYSTLLLAGSEGHPKSIRNPSAGNYVAPVNCFSLATVSGQFQSSFRAISEQFQSSVEDYLQRDVV